MIIYLTHKIDGTWSNRYYDFTLIIIRLTEYYCIRKEYEKIKQNQLRKYEYKARIVPNDIFYNIYKIPRTFLVAYSDSINECALISAYWRMNINYLYLIIGCADIICYIGEYMYEMMKYDYSLYVCAN